MPVLEVDLLRRTRGGEETPRVGALAALIVTATGTRPMRFSSVGV
jgi:hypothetical protein